MITRSVTLPDGSAPSDGVNRLFGSGVAKLKPAASPRPPSEHSQALDGHLTSRHRRRDHRAGSPPTARASATRPLAASRTVPSPSLSAMPMLTRRWRFPRAIPPLSMVPDQRTPGDLIPRTCCSHRSRECPEGQQPRVSAVGCSLASRPRARWRTRWNDSSRIGIARDSTGGGAGRRGIRP
jgi:hypothetical protein